MHIHILICLEIAFLLLFKDFLTKLIDLLDFEDESHRKQKIVGQQELRLEVYDTLAALRFHIYNESNRARDELHRSSILL